MARGGQVLYILKWDWLPDKDPLSNLETGAWCTMAVPRSLGVKGAAEYRTYRTAVGAPQIVLTAAFPDVSAWADWYGDKTIQSLHGELAPRTAVMVSELWYPSPLAPEPVQPKGGKKTPGSVVYLVRWDPDPETAKGYKKWSETAIERSVAVPGPVEFRAYRTSTGSPHVVLAYEFPDIPTWGTWYAKKEIQDLRNEAAKLVVNSRSELWGPEPMFSGPIRRN